MTTFAIGAATLVLLALWMLRPAWRQPLATGAAPSSTNASVIGVLGEQLAALDREHSAGQLDAAQHRATRSELQRRMLAEAAGDEAPIDSTNSPKALMLVAFAIPLFAAALYAAIGNPSGLNAAPGTPAPSEAQAATKAAAEPEVSPEAVQAMLASLAERLQKQPSGNAASDLQGWTMLARSYATMQRFADADRAYARAIALAPQDAQLLADRADVLAVLQGQRTEGEPDRLIAQALRIDPKNLKALALAGSAAFERKDFAAASGYWQQARERAPDGSAFAAGLDRSLAAAREAGGDAGTASATNAAATSPAVVATSEAAPAVGTTPARITGRVSLAPALAAKAAPTDTVFVYARAAEGSRMPLAIVRRTVADLPFEFTLDDSMAMSPQAKLSGASRVIVGARVSRSGNAMPQSGDLFGETAAIGNRSSAVSLAIEGARP
jgi:cytochrome c-type biogenesis protein CcmH